MTADGLTAAELRSYRDRGWRCVRFVWCNSNVISTVERQSCVYLTQNWRDRTLRGIGYSLLSLACGPWGVPWGIWRTAESIWINSTGGRDVTVEAIERAPVER